MREYENTARICSLFKSYKIDLMKKLEKYNKKTYDI